MKNTIAEVIAEWQTGKTGIQNNLVLSHGMLETGYIMLSNKGVIDECLVTTALPSATFGLDSAISTSSFTKTLSTLYLKPAKVTDFAGVDSIAGSPGGMAGFIDKNLPNYVRGLLNTLATTAITGTTASAFAGLDTLVVANSRYKDTGATTTGSFYTSIYAVRWGLACYWTYNPVLPLGALPISLQVYWSATAPVSYNDGSSNYLGNVITTGTTFNLAIHDVYSIYALKNVTEAGNDASGEPTVLEIQDIIDAVNGSAVDTVIYVSRKGRNLISKACKASYQWSDPDGKYANLVGYFNGVPIVVEDAITNTNALTT